MTPSHATARPPFPISALDYDLPPELIAQQPIERRDRARLLVVDRATQSFADATVADLPRFLKPNDLLVLNNTRVIPARFTARRATGAVIPGLFLSESSPRQWLVMLERSRRLRIGESLQLTDPHGLTTATLRLTESIGEGRWRGSVDTDLTAAELLDRIGHAPLPPYIHRDTEPSNIETHDRERYQTVYASVLGAVAAPTAGLHFTPELLDRLRAAGIETAYLTLHVGLGTFKPISANDLSQHVMHEEHYHLSHETAEAVLSCRERGGRIVAVGTTTVRVLESTSGGCHGQAQLARANDATGRDITLRPGYGSTNIFIYPPYQFRAVDALMTNFHLPRSTLLALVMACAGIELTRQAYAHAIERRYRFYSYGDAMLIV